MRSKEFRLFDDEKIFVLDNELVYEGLVELLRAYYIFYIVCKNFVYFCSYDDGNILIYFESV